MFIHENRLQHLLTPAAYHDPRQYQREMDHVFLPAWHIVGTTRDLRRPGDFLTLHLLGQPLLVRNIDGEIHTFLNVCAHRHCTLISKPKGYDPHFRCQYHGWEYDKDGRTARIPDARCFRPFDRENAHLRKYRTETCGELVFASLAEEGPSLREFLGHYFDFIEKGFSTPWRLNWTWQTEYKANWKIPIENSLESYHIPCLHARTFGNLPEEQNCSHDLNPLYTTFCTPEPDAFAAHFQAWFIRRLGMPVTSVYTHHHAHPHLTIASLDVMRLMQMVLPTSPTTCLHRVWLYTPGSPGWNPWTKSLAGILSSAVHWIARKVILEDAPIFAEVQRGLEASVHPGVIGTREERIFLFQDYVQRKCDNLSSGGRIPLDLQSSSHG
jgi:choline monooxygenase